MIKVVILSLVLLQSSDSVLNGIESSMKTGNAKELVKYFNEMVELKIDGGSSNYSRTQAEVVLRKFFQSNPSRGFFYIHKGASTSEGLKYAIGQYTTNSGTYRIVMFLKMEGKQYVIDTLRITKDDSLDSKGK